MKTYKIQGDLDACKLSFVEYHCKIMFPKCSFGSHFLLKWWLKLLPVKHNLKILSKDYCFAYKHETIRNEKLLETMMKTVDIIMKRCHCLHLPNIASYKGYFYAQCYKRYDGVESCGLPTTFLIHWSTYMKWQMQFTISMKIFVFSNLNFFQKNLT